MRYSWIVALMATAGAAHPSGSPKPGKDGKFTIESKGIKAQASLYIDAPWFIPYGATLTNLFVKDKNGEDVDVVLGYDDIEYYPKDPGHPVYNSIPGRYVNRIGYGHYELDGKTYNTEKNDGDNTLHSGTNNWSYRTWKVASAKPDSVTFSIYDKSNSSQNMLGDVEASVVYTVKDGVLNIKMNAKSLDQATPLMLTHHTYFNLDAFKNPDTDKVWEHTLHMPYSANYLEADQGALPTGRILQAAPGSINDFASRPGLALGHARDQPGFAGNCGADGACEGYNGYFTIAGKPAPDAVVVALASPFSGIRAELRTDQPGVVLYSCNWFDGTAPLKAGQGLAGRRSVTRSSCVAIEAQDYVDGINHPEWDRLHAQISKPGDKYSWESSWTFSQL